jgi:hypothetical protein
MKNLTLCVAVLSGLIAWNAMAAAPASAPAGATGACKDGTYTTNDTKKGACAGHQGVKDWFGSSAAQTTAAAPAAAAAKTAASAPVAGGAPGQVWVNTNSKVYHCPGTKYYGKTKQGEYMSETAAKAAGNHADHGKACS